MPLDLNTALKAAEEILTRDAQILASVQDAVVVTDLLGTVVFWNEGATRLFGWQAEEMLGRPAEERVPKYARAEIASRLAVLQQGGEVASERLDYRKDGSRVWIEARVSRIRDREGKITGYLGLAHDISDRKQAEGERDQLLRRLQMKIDRMPLGYVLFDADFRIIDWNPAAQTIFGYSKEEVLGTGPPFEKLLATSTWQTMGEVIARLRSGEMSAHTVNDNLTRDGRTITCEWHNTPLLDQGSSFTGLLSLVQDITERRLLEQRLVQWQKMEAIGQLAGGVAHDFNNMLTVINGTVDLLLMQVPKDDKSRPLLAEAGKAGEKAAGLTRQLLAFSRKSIVAPKVLDLNVVVTDLEQMLRRLIGEDIDMAVYPRAEHTRVKADPGQLEQVVMNLAVNARDAMPTGGKLTIETADVQLDEDYARTHTEVSPGRYVLLAVSDTGHGMTEEVKAHIFEPFFTTKELGKGTGLGLSTLYGIVKQANGHVSVYSEPGRGSTFKVYLPRVEAAVAGPSQPGLAHAPRGTETVLLVEDDEPVRQLASLVLARSGYTVLEASDGEEALRIASPIDLLVSDVVLPKIDGRKLADRLLATNPQLKVLFLSGYTDDAIVRYGIFHEKVNFLQKPFSTVALAQKVRDVLDSPG